LTFHFLYSLFYLCRQTKKSDKKKKKKRKKRKKNRSRANVAYPRQHDAMLTFAKVNSHK